MSVHRLFRFDRTHRRDPDVEAWFDDQTPALARLARPWFERLRVLGDDVREVLHDGHPTACVGDAAFAHVDAFQAHVNLGFFHGSALPDPAGLLEGAGKFMRHVKLRPGVDVDGAALGALLDVAYADVRARLEEA